MKKVESSIRLQKDAAVTMGRNLYLWKHREGM